MEHEDEVVVNLRPRTRGGARSRYSDRRQVEDGARQAEALVRAGEVSERLLDALIGALDHDQPSARAAVIRTLALVDRPEAREAMIAELLEPGVTAAVRRACVAGLRRQVEAAPSPAVRAARRRHLLDAARRAAALDRSPVAAELAALAGDVAADRLVVEPSAFEIADLSARGLRVVLDERPLLATPALPVTAADRRAAGPDWEQKYGISAIDLDGDVPTIHLTATTWREGNSFHRALRRTAELAPEQVDHLTEGWLRSTFRLPGLAAVHVVVVTADRRLVVARRSASSAYAPGTWSASIEEQVTDHDVQSGDVLAAAARRGVLEELGERTAVAAVMPLSLIVEMPLIGTAPVLLAELHDTAADLRAAAAAGAHDQELVDLIDIAFDPDAIDRYLADHDPSALHPTTAIRLRIAARRLRRRSGAAGQR